MRDIQVRWRGFLLDTELRRASEGTSTRAARRAAWGTVLVPRPRQNPHRARRRRDLELSLRLEGGERYHTTLHRAVGLACLPCFWDDEGHLLAQPYSVEAHNWSEHEVHHLRGHNDCRLKALAVVTTELHQKLTTGEIERLVLPLDSRGRIRYPQLVAASH